PGPCPYPGLEPFTVDDAGFYHGRERLLADLLDACIRATASPSSPLIVVGPSGSGKTSLLRAGLLPALRRAATEELPGTAHAPAILLTPGERPLHTLAARISPDRPLSGEELTERPEAIARLMAGTRARDAGPIGPLLIVDQLEELFTACPSAREREAFVRALRAAAEAGALVVLALRSDFYPHAQALPDLAAVLRDHQVPAGPMSREELRAAIERPAAEAGLVLEDGLADLLLTELGAVDQSGGPTGVLPLLSHTLWATWRRRSGGRLTFAGYRAVGGIGSAIARTAEEVYEELDTAGRAAARLLLTRLVRIDSETADTGRAADRRALLEGLPDPAAGAEALRRLVDARLVTVDDRTVRISHDALLRAWPTLRDWIDADREWLRARRPIAADADEWWASGREPSLLYRGVRLAAARESAERAGLTTVTGQPGAAPATDPDPRLTTFLRHSWRHERRRRRTRTAVLSVLVVLALLVAAAGVTAVVYQREAVAERDAADAHRAEAVARLVAADAARLRDSRPGLSRQLGLIAYQLDPEVGFGPLLAAHETPGTYHQAAVVADLDVTADGSMLAMNADGDVVLWSTAGTGELARLPGTGPGPVALSGNGRLLAAVAPTEREVPAGELATAGTVRLWDTTDPTSPVSYTTL
ncbi:ATP-binding protein, partial [Streptomyces calidiresistens]|uniref:ATP-binding protein n=1 Tax=Streptomyces calidiresistens TaxID=1485586 RepID=UPI001E4B228A